MYNPILYCDPSGHFVIPYPAKIIDDIQKFFIKIFNSFTGISNAYEAMDEAIVAWGNEYYPKTIIDHKERGAIIRSIKINGRKYYYVGKTRKRFEGTCWNAFVFGLTKGFGKVECFVHTHTAYPNDNDTWNPVDYGPSDADLWLFNVSGINRQLIANEKGPIYEFLEDGSMIIIQP